MIAMAGAPANLYIVKIRVGWNQRSVKRNLYSVKIDAGFTEISPLAEP
jgi:hypothetical protein